jgi:hypothetical protein
MTISETPTGTELSPAVAWSQRVRRVGGFIHRSLLAGPRRRQQRRRSGDRTDGRCLRSRCRGLGVRRPGHRRDRPQAHQPRSEARHRHRRIPRPRRPPSHTIAKDPPVQHTRPVTNLRACSPDRLGHRPSVTSAVTHISCLRLPGPASGSLPDPSGSKEENGREVENTSRLARSRASVRPGGPVLSAISRPILFELWARTPHPAQV